MQWRARVLRRPSAADEQEISHSAGGRQFRFTLARKKAKGASRTNERLADWPAGITLERSRNESKALGARSGSALRSPNCQT